jgi:hypothetical protein
VILIVLVSGDSCVLGSWNRLCTFWACLSPRFNSCKCFSSFGRFCISIDLGIAKQEFLLTILAVQVAEIVRRYDVDCVPNAYRGNKQAYIKDNSIPKNCIQEVKVIQYLICLL